MSKISEYFVAAMSAEIDKRPRGTKTQLAKLVGTTPSHITDILSGRKYGSEEMKRALAEALGWNYEEFLKYGKCLLEGKEYTAPQPGIRDYDEKSYTPVPLVVGTSTALALGVVGNLKGTAVVHALSPVLGPAIGVAAAVGLVGGAALGGLGMLSGKLKKSKAKSGKGKTTPDEPSDIQEPLPLLLYKPLLGNHQDSNHLLALPFNDSNMEPTIPAGAIVIIDMSDRTFEDGKIFMLASEEGASQVIRARGDADSILLTNDNAAYPPKVLKQPWDGVVIGKVIRSEHGHD